MGCYQGARSGRCREPRRSPEAGPDDGITHLARSIGLLGDTNRVRKEAKKLGKGRRETNLPMTRPSSLASCMRISSASASVPPYASQEALQLPRDA
jgi:hypothetical protein